jgi:hypothetical protein
MGTESVRQKTPIQEKLTNSGGEQMQSGKSNKSSKKQTTKPNGQSPKEIADARKQIQARELEAH